MKFMNNNKLLLKKNKLVLIRYIIQFDRRLLNLILKIYIYYIWIIYEFNNNFYKINILFFLNILWLNFIIFEILYYYW